MVTFFSLLTTAFSCIFYGVITTAVIMSILYFVLKSLSKGIVQSFPFYITGLILAFLLICNLSVLIGAFQVKSTTEAMELSLRQLTENTSGIVNAKESQAVFDYLVDEYPLLGNYLQIADFSGNDISNLAMVIPEVVRKEMNHVIWSKFLWSLGYIVVACFIAILFEQGQRQRKGVTTRRSRVSNRRVRMYR